MSKKVKPAAKPKGAATAADESVVTRQTAFANYAKACKAIGVPVNPQVNDVLRGGEEDGELVNLILEGDPPAPLGPGGVRALVMALQGAGPGITSGPYLPLRYIRIWKQDVGDEGAVVLASLLQSRPPGINIAYLELLDCGIGEVGCRALGDAIRAQQEPGLLSLNLKYNPGMGDAGVSALCDGLFANSVLKHLHLDYCGIGQAGAVKLAQLVSIPASAVETLSLQGNVLRDAGLLDLSLGLARSQRLVKLNIADNGIRHNAEALGAFRDALVRCKALAHVDLTFNLIEPEGAKLLLPALTPENAKLVSFQVDASLPSELFAQLNRAPPADGKKKGKKKGGGAKKKK